MLPSFELSEPESINLQELAEHHPYPDFRLRVLRLLALSVTNGQIQNPSTIPKMPVGLSPKRNEIKNWQH
jgi:hypothetical protein